MQIKTANGTKRPVKEHNVNWRKVEKQVRNLRQRIFRATKEGDLKKVRSLQKLMLRSYSNTFSCVRRVTQINAGKNTAGIDGMVVKTAKAKNELIKKLTSCEPWKVKPTKRVYIPKSNGKSRPLGIPTIIDRCLQAKVKNALEPFWEAKFEPISYGFRPGRSCHDAIAAIFTFSNSRGRKRWIVDADIKGAFDNIDHKFLLKIIGDFPAKELIKQWLKAGYVENNTFNETTTGTPQGGIISPLLANIALHNMEEALGIKRDSYDRVKGSKAIVRYADDFIVFCETKEEAEEVKTTLSNWLKERGLTFSPEKTRIIHITEGFDFLGFNIKLYKSSKKYGCKILIRPSKKSIKQLKDKIKEEWRKLVGQNIRAVITRLNPIIRGWANYFRIGVAKEIFAELDNWMFNREVKFTKRTHPLKPWYWINKKYWGRLNKYRKDNWVFGCKNTGKFLLKFRWFKIERHIMIKGRSSPDDPKRNEYWLLRNKRKIKDAGLKKKIQIILQKYQCPICFLPLLNDEKIIKYKPRNKIKVSDENSCQIVHKFCSTKQYEFKF